MEFPGVLAAWGLSLGCCERWKEKTTQPCSCSWEEASGMGTGCWCSGKGPFPAVLSLGSCKVITAHAVPETNPFLGSSLLQRSVPREGQRGAYPAAKHRGHRIRLVHWPSSLQHESRNTNHQ